MTSVSKSTFESYYDRIDSPFTTNFNEMDKNLTFKHKEFDLWIL